MSHQWFEKKEIVWRCFFGNLIDLTIVALMTALLAGSAYLFVGNYFSEIHLFKTKVISKAYTKASLITFFTLYLSYFSASYYLMKGETIGKMITGTKVYTSKFDVGPSLIQSMIRSLGNLVEFLSGYSLKIIPIISSTQKDFPSIISKTSYYPVENSEDNSQLLLFEKKAS